MLLVEDLLLLLTDDVAGKLLVASTPLDLALGGAQLLDLSLAGKVDVDDRERLVVVDLSPTGDDLLDATLAVLQDQEGKKPSAVIGKVGRSVRPALYERLTSARILRPERSTVLGLFPTTRWLATSPYHGVAVRRALASALVDRTTPTARSAALVALLNALRVTHKVVDPRQHGLRRRDLDRRAKEIAEGSWSGRAVRHAVDAMTAAVTAAVAGGIIVSAGGG